MVKNGQSAEPVRVEFKSSSHARLDVEVLRASELMRRASADHLGAVQRLGFHLVALYVDGQTTHTVDFVTHRCRRGTVIAVQPRQVQRLALRPGVEAVILLFTSSFLFPERPNVGALWQERFFDDVAWPSALRLGGRDMEAIETWFLKLEETYMSTDRGPLGAALMRHLVSVVLLELARRGQLSTAHVSDVVPAARARARRFESDLERSYRVTRNVNDYAMHLGCSPKTLDRTCRSVLGASAKALIDARVSLEARRLLAHTTMTVAAIGDALGFSEPTNFVKFFRARTGRLPGAFRASTIGQAVGA
ncbi:MAG: helix-turn-helix domain-containing protein [Vicinamibacterales bacterium]